MIVQELILISKDKNIFYISGGEPRLLESLESLLCRQYTEIEFSPEW